MKKSLLTAMFFCLTVIPLLAFTDDFESGDDWTTVSGSINQSVNENHTPGGMFSLEGFATFSQPAEAVRQETSAATTQRWRVEGYVFTNAANRVQFGWYDNSTAGFLHNVNNTNTWVYVADTIKFVANDFDVDFYVTGIGTDAYLDDVATYQIPTSIPEEFWKNLSE